jgi:SP family galactose:H+ symporter-like MFS transporter
LSGASGSLRAGARPGAGHAAAPRTRLLVSAASAAVGGLVFGYQLGVVSGALLLIRNDFALSSFQQGLLVSLVPLGAMAGGLLTMRLADAHGRRRTLLVDAVVLIAGIGLSAVAPSYAVLLPARAIVGLAVGSVSSAVPLYLSEIAPPGIRGRVVTMQQLMVTLGILASYCVNLLFAGSGSWRAMFGVGLLPAALFLAGMLRAPETPSWLAAHGDEAGARRVIVELAGEREAPRFLEDVRRMREQQREQVGLRRLWRSAARPALVIGLTLAAVQQFSGINTIVAYAPSIMQKTGLGVSDSILYSVIIGALNVVATVVSFRLVDRLGRRPLLLTSLAGMTVTLVLLGLTFVLHVGAAGSWLALVCILGYITAFAVGAGPIFWLLIAEIFPPAARSAGAGVSTTMVWLCNFLVLLLFLPLSGAIGQGPTFWVFAAVAAAGLEFVRRYVPETKGRAFSDIDADVRARWAGARDSTVRMSAR